MLKDTNVIFKFSFLFNYLFIYFNFTKFRRKILAFKNLVREIIKRVFKEMNVKNEILSNEPTVS